MRTSRFGSPYPDGVPGHRGGHETEREAALAIAPKLTEAQQQVYELLVRRGRWGQTWPEVVKHFGDPSMQRRLSDLVQLKLAIPLVVDGETIKRTPSGHRACTVWVAVTDYVQGRLFEGGRR